MKITKVFITLSIAVMAAGCGKKPVADFSWDPIEPNAGQEVRFTNQSKDAKSYSWNFGDMSIGKEVNPAHIYRNSGSYIVDLTAHNGLNSDQKTVIIVVKDSTGKMAK